LSFNLKEKQKQKRTISRQIVTGDSIVQKDENNSCDTFIDNSLFLVLCKSKWVNLFKRIKLIDADSGRFVCQGTDGRETLVC
jgi:hypothetical protein